MSYFTKKQRKRYFSLRPEMRNTAYQVKWDRLMREQNTYERELSKLLKEGCSSDEAHLKMGYKRHPTKCEWVKG